MKKILGLKVGVNHIGWAFIDEVDESKIELPNFTLSVNTAAKPGCVYIHHNRPPLIVAQLIVFKSFGEALNWGEAKAASKENTIHAVRGQFGIDAILAQTDYYRDSSDFVPVIRRMIDWYCFNGIQDDPFTESYPIPSNDEKQK
jgi:hypothetical protein